MYKSFAAGRYLKLICRHTSYSPSVLCLDSSAGRYLYLNPKDEERNDGKERVSFKLVELNLTPSEAYFKFLIYDQSYGKHQEQFMVILEDITCNLFFFSLCDLYVLITQILPLLGCQLQLTIFSAFYLLVVP